jgi:hypothetical protein
VITELDAVPLTPNGKIDRNALPDPTTSAMPREFVAPQTESERQIADIWMSLLDLERVGAHDNFFELGGHSLLAVKAVALFAEKSGIRIHPRELFFQSLQQVAAAGQPQTP